MRIFELYRSETEIQEPEEEIINNYFHYGKNEGLSALSVNLSKLGWTLMGSGYFSYVYEHPDKSYVMKITILPDPGYAEYVKLIKSHPNKYFPKISDMRVLKIHNSDYYVYLIEKLKTIPKYIRNTYSRAINQIISNPDRSINNLFPEGVPEVITRNSDLVAALKLIRSYARHTGYSIDLHGENIMKREDGTLVITDPYSFYHDSKKIGTQTPF